MPSHRRWPRRRTIRPQQHKQPGNVAGAGGDKYYTDDHYESFKFIVEGS